MYFVAIVLTTAPCITSAQETVRVVDQSVPIRDLSVEQGGAINPDQWLAQTFKVGATGYLSELQLVLYDPSPSTAGIEVAVRRFNRIPPVQPDCPIGCIYVDFSPVGLLAASDALQNGLPDASALETWTAIEFGQDRPFLSRGDEYAIVLTSLEQSSINWRNTNDPNGTSIGDVYPFGQGYVAPAPLTGDNRWLSVGYADFNFQTIMAVPVPEPSTLGLSIVFGCATAITVWHRCKDISSNRLMQGQ
jgi:hypothetical protein